jgi:hypothetical protein
VASEVAPFGVALRNCSAVGRVVREGRFLEYARQGDLRLYP